MGLEELLENVIFAVTVTLGRDRPGPIRALRVQIAAHQAVCEALIARYGMPSEPWVTVPIFEPRPWLYSTNPVTA